MPHILASITAHGLGHLAITAPLLEHLHGLAPDCRVTVSSGIDEAALRHRIHCPFDFVPDPLDFGLRMHRDLSVDAKATVDAYAAIHADWNGTVERRSEWLAGTRCDVLLANISYLNIAAAHRAGIPAVAVCPLNWADLYRHFAPDSRACREVFGQMVEAYNRAGMFLAPRPSMPMAHFHNVENIPPVAQVGTDHRAPIEAEFGLDAGTRLVLLALGGQEADFDPDHLPELDGVCWLAERGPRRGDILPISRAGLVFPDLLASCDLLVAKPGYGAFTEAACLGKPVVYMRRPAWPEEVYLIEWLRRYVPCREAPRDDARAFGAAIRDLIGAPALQPCSPDGIETAVRRVLQQL